MAILFITFTPIKAEAKAFGKVETSRTESIGAGQCMTTTTTTTKFLWITTSKTIEKVIFTC